MALPTTNLTLHVDASDTGNLFTTLDGGGNHTGTPADGGAVQVWDDEGDGVADVILRYSATTGQSPTWRSVTPLMLHPCLDFDGSDDQLVLYNQTGSSGKNIATVFGAGAKTIAMAFYPESITTTNASVYDQDALFKDFWQQIGFVVRNNGGTRQLTFFNDEVGTSIIRSVVRDIAESRSWVAVGTHDGTDLALTIIDDTGAEDSVSTASDDTRDMTGGLFIARATSGPFYNGRIGEIAFYDAALTGTPLADLKDYFTVKWLTGGGAGIIPILQHHYRQQGMV